QSSISYELTDSSISVTDVPGFDPFSTSSGAGVGYSGLAYLTLNGGGGPEHTYEVSNTASGTTTTINAAGVDDVVNVNATTGALFVNLSGSGNPTVNVSPTALDLFTIASALTVKSMNGTTFGTLNLDDQNDPSPLTLLPGSSFSYQIGGTSV